MKFKFKEVEERLRNALGILEEIEIDGGVDKDLDKAIRYLTVLIEKYEEGDI